MPTRSEIKLTTVATQFNVDDTGRYFLFRIFPNWLNVGSLTKLRFQLNCMDDCHTESTCLLMLIVIRYLNTFFDDFLFVPRFAIGDKRYLATLAS